MADHQQGALRTSAFDSPAPIEPGPSAGVRRPPAPVVSRPSLICPACGFTQEAADECMKCGLVIAKYRPGRRSEAPVPTSSGVRSAGEIAADLGEQGYEPRVPVTRTVEDDGFFAPERRGLDKGMLGGIAMMAIAVVWFGLGWAAGYIFFYPPILFVIGLFGLVKGLLTGNVAG